MMQRILLKDLAGMIGREFGPSDWVEISQDIVDRYGGDVSRSIVDRHGHGAGDLEWMHFDTARATEAFGGTIMHYPRAKVVVSSTKP